MIRIIIEVVKNGSCKPIKNDLIIFIQDGTVGKYALVKTEDNLQFNQILHW